MYRHGSWLLARSFMQSAAGIASFPGFFCWSYSSHVKLLIKRVMLSGFINTKLLATTEWLEYEPQGEVRKVKRHRDVEASLQYIPSWLPLSRAGTNWLFTHTHTQYARRAETTGHRILCKVTRFTPNFHTDDLSLYQVHALPAFRHFHFLSLVRPSSSS